MVFSVILVLLLVLLNGVFAMGELALISARRPRLCRARAARRAGGGPGPSPRPRTPQRFLPTVQVGITLVSIIEGTFGGARIASSLTPYLERVPLLRPFANELALTLVVIVITALMLVLGELVPKAARPATSRSHRGPAGAAAGRAVARGQRPGGLAAEPLVLDGAAPRRHQARAAAGGDRGGTARGAGRGRPGGGVRGRGTQHDRAAAAPRRPAGARDHDASQRAVLDRAPCRPRGDRGGAQDRHAHPPGGLRRRRGRSGRRHPGQGRTRPDAGTATTCRWTRSFRAPQVVPETISAFDALERLRGLPIGLLLVLDEYGSFEGIVTSADVFRRHRRRPCRTRREAPVHSHCGA